MRLSHAETRPMCKIVLGHLGLPSAICEVQRLRSTLDKDWMDTRSEMAPRNGRKRQERR